MDSYGIHSAQLQGNSMAGYVNNYNDKVKAMKQSAMGEYNKAKSDASSSQDLLDAHLGGTTAMDVANGITGAYASYQATKKYGGVGNAFARNTSANMYNMTSGKVGLPAMGPNEAVARGIDRSEIDIGGAIKKTAGAMKGGVESAVSSGTKAVSGAVGSAVSSAKSGVENFGARAMGLDQEQGVTGRRTTDPTTGRPITGARPVAETPVEPTDPRGPVGSQPSRAELGGDTMSRPDAPPLPSANRDSARAQLVSEAPDTTPTGGNVAEAQQKDKDLGVGWEKEGAQTDATKSMSQLREGAQAGASDEGLSLTGKIIKKGAMTAGLDQGIAHGLGAVSGAVVGGAMGIGTAVSDFGDGEKQWKGDNTTQKAGDVFSMAGSAMEVADTFVPELAPVSAVLGGIGAVLDFVGGEEKKGVTATASATKLQQSQNVQSMKAPDYKQTTATTTGQTSLQKVGGISSSSSY